MPAAAKSGGEREAIIAALKDFFSRRDDVSLAFLFGSQAKGIAVKRSDVDVAVYFRSGYDVEKLRTLTDELENLLQKEVDLIVLNDANPSLAWSALRGVPLFIADRHFYLEYMLDVSREAEDFNEFILDLWRLRRERRKREAESAARRDQ